MRIRCATAQFLHEPPEGPAPRVVMGINDRDYVRREGPSFLGMFAERGKVCKWLIGLNIVFFILQLLTSDREGGLLTNLLQLNADKVVLAAGSCCARPN